MCDISAMHYCYYYQLLCDAHTVPEHTHYRPFSLCGASFLSAGASFLSAGARLAKVSLDKQFKTAQEPMDVYNQHKMI